MNPWWLSLLGVVLASTADAQTDNDTVRSSTKPRFQVVDGDTMKFGPQLVRLFGIDAPEKGQTCDKGKWLPGPLATKALIDLIAGRPVACHQVDYDAKKNHPMGLCFAGNDETRKLLSAAADWRVLATGRTIRSPRCRGLPNRTRSARFCGAGGSPLQRHRGASQHASELGLRCHAGQLPHGPVAQL
jgi:hypothetical protein